MIRPLTTQEHEVLKRLTRSNAFHRLEGSRAQTAFQMSHEELVEPHPSETDSYAFTWKGLESMRLPIQEDEEADTQEA
jgi:hypothetical protein